MHGGQTDCGMLFRFSYIFVTCFVPQYVVILRKCFWAYAKNILTLFSVWVQCFTYFCEEYFIYDII